MTMEIRSSAPDTTVVSTTMPARVERGRRPSPRLLRIIATTIAIATIASPASHAGEEFAIGQHAVAGGGISRAHSACFDLSATLGQAVAGTSSGDAFALTSGFHATAPATPTNAIFNDGFEDCQP